MINPPVEPGTTVSPRTSASEARPGGDRWSEALGATTALARVISALSPLAGRRASIRYTVVDHCLDGSGVDIETRADCLTAAIVADLGRTLSEHSPAGLDPAAGTVEVLQAISGLETVASALRHQDEHWDGSGRPDSLSGIEIPLIARMVAVGSAVAGAVVDADQAVDWDAARRRVLDRAGIELDPTIARACVEGIDSGAMPQLATLDNQLARLSWSRPSGRHSSDALASITATIAAIDDLVDVVALIADEGRRSVEAAAVSVARYDEDQGEVRVLVNVGDLSPGQTEFPDDEVHPFEVPLGADLRATTLNSPDGRPAGIIAAPVHIDGALWGFVLARSGDLRGPFGAADLEVFDRVAKELANGIDKVEQLSELIDMALRDPLTGLANRRVLHQRLEEAFERPLEQRLEVALVMCDLDRLKIINDTYGHGKGDDAIVGVGNALRHAAAIQPGTEVCRIGGDEFCIFVDSGGWSAAEAIHDRASELVAEIDDPPVLVSCGIAVASSTTQTPTDLLRAADEAQYAVKRARRAVFGLDTSAGGRRELRDG